MSRAGERASVEAFFSWCAGVVEARAGRMAAREILDGRFTVDGHEVPGEWSAAQLDGYGAWVWALGGHVRRHGVDPAPWLSAARLSLRYAADCWQMPCFDWWEERRGVHVATLAALYGGLTSGLVEEDWATEAAESIRSAVRRDGVVDGRLVARLGEGGLDASLIAVATPFGLLGHDDPLMEATVRTVESELMVGPRRPPAPARRVLRRRALGRPRRAPRLALRPGGEIGGGARRAGLDRRRGER